MSGIGTNKAAKTFTPQEWHRKSNKNVYTCWKPFWLLVAVARMVNARWEANTACEMIQDIYIVVAGK